MVQKRLDEQDDLTMIGEINVKKNPISRIRIGSKEPLRMNESRIVLIESDKGYLPPLLKVMKKRLPRVEVMKHNSNQSLKQVAAASLTSLRPEQQHSSSRRLGSEFLKDDEYDGSQDDSIMSFGRTASAQLYSSDFDDDSHGREAGAASASSRRDYENDGDYDMAFHVALNAIDSEVHDAEAEMQHALIASSGGANEKVNSTVSNHSNNEATHLLQQKIMKLEFRLETLTMEHESLIAKNGILIDTVVALKNIQKEAAKYRNECSKLRMINEELQGIIKDLPRTNRE